MVASAIGEISVNAPHHAEEEPKQELASAITQLLSMVADPAMDQQPNRNNVTQHIAQVSFINPVAIQLKCVKLIIPQNDALIL